MGLLLSVAAVAAYAQSTTAGEKEVLQVLYAVDQADDRRDKATLERLMANEYLYQASNGTVQTKATMSIASALTQRYQGANPDHDRPVR